jgi:adenylosuccinate lyase
MRTILQRIEARVRRWLPVGAALLVPLAPAALVPDRYVSAILNWIESIDMERIESIAAVTNALTLMP